MNRSLLHVIAGGYGIPTRLLRHTHEETKKTYVEWKVDDTVQVS